MPHLTLLTLLIISSSLFFVFSTSQTINCQQYLLHLQSLYLTNHEQFKQEMFPYLLFSGKGIDDLGYPGSCLNQSSKFSYSTAQLQFTPNETTFIGYIGLCFTNQCTINDLNLGAHFIIDYLLNDYQFEFKSKFVASPMELSFSPLALSFGLVFGLFALLGMLAPIKAWVDMCMANQDQQYNLRVTYINLDNSSNEYDQQKALTIQPIIKKISIRQKWKAIWKNEESVKIYSFSLFRILAVPFLVYGQVFFEANKAAFNYLSFDSSIYSRFYAKVAMFAYYIPDIFFMISGFLFCRKMLAISENQENPYYQIFTNIGHKFLRLYPIYISAFVIYWCITPALHCGPVWYAYEEQVQACDDSWWRVLLMIDNWWQQGCYAILWFVQVEAQFTLFIGIFFILYFFQRLVSYGYLFIGLLSSWVLLFLFSAQLPTTLEAVLNPQSLLFFKSFYSHLPFYLWGTVLAIFASNTSVRETIQEKILSSLAMMITLSIISIGMISLIILRPWDWNTEAGLTLQLSFCRFGILMAFTLIFLNGMFRQNRQTHSTVIHQYSYYTYPIILCSEFVTQGSFWSVSSFFYIDAVNVFNNSIPILLVSIATGLALGMIMDFRNLVKNTE